MVAVTEAVNDREAELEAVTVRVADVVMVVLLVAVSLAVSEEEAVFVTVAVAVTVGVTDTVADGEAVTLTLPLTDAVVVAVSLADQDKEGEVDIEPVAEDEDVAERESEAECEEDGDSDGDNVPETEIVGVSDMVLENESESVTRRQAGRGGRGVKHRRHQQPTRMGKTARKRRAMAPSAHGILQTQRGYHHNAPGNEGMGATHQTRSPLARQWQRLSTTLRAWLWQSLVCLLLDQSTVASRPPEARTWQTALWQGEVASVIL